MISAKDSRAFPTDRDVKYISVLPCSGEENRTAIQFFKLIPCKTVLPMFAAQFDSATEQVRLLLGLVQ